MKYSIFGESHGPAIGVVLEGVPPGLALDLDAVRFDLARRAPGKNALSTPRREGDEPRVLSGLFEGRTTGAPLCAVIENTDTRSGDYERTKDLARPGHADYAAHVRYQGFNDYRGGGHFSGRLTAPLVFAGGVAKQLLAQKGIYVGAHISTVYGVNDNALEDWESLREAAAKDFPVLNDERGAEMQSAILEARNDGDSVGGAIECAVFGLPAGLGAGLRPERRGHFLPVPVRRPGGEGGGLRGGDGLRPHAGLGGQRPAVYGRRRHGEGGAELRRGHQRRHHQRHAPGVRGHPAPHPLHRPAAVHRGHGQGRERGAGAPGPARPLCGPPGGARH